MVLPLSITRWSLFNHKTVSSAATFFAVSMFNLSGAMNVLLFLIVRPDLLLFYPPEEFSGSEIELRHASTIFPDAAKYHHNPQPTGTGFAEDVGNRVRNPALKRSGSSHIALSHVNSGPSLDDI